MKTQNKVQLIGYLGKDPMVSIAVNGCKRAYLSLATHIFRKNQDGTAFKKTTWHKIVAWNRKAENIENDFIKGSHVLVEGEIEYRQFSRNGEIRYETRVCVSNIMNLDR